MKSMLSKKIFSWFYKFQEKQFVPKKEEVDNDSIKDLSKRLKSDTYKETLTNILEWQDRNLKFWEERWLTFMVLLVISYLSIIIILWRTLEINPSSTIILVLGLVLLFIIERDILNFIFYLITIFVFFIVYVLLLVYRIQEVSINYNTLFFIVMVSLLLGAFISIIIHLLIKYRNIKLMIPQFKIKDTFKMSLPIEKILEYRLSICRD